MRILKMKLSFPPSTKIFEGSLQRKSINCLIFVLLACLFSCNLFAGIPWLVDDKKDSGQPRHWPNNKVQVVVDAGRLSSGVSHDTAVDWLKECIEDWTTRLSIKDSDGNAVNATTFRAEIKDVARDAKGKPVDIDLSDFTNYFDPKTAGMYFDPPVIIFDDTGEIIDFVSGEEGGKDRYPGITLIWTPASDLMPLYRDGDTDDGSQVKYGFVILNGLFLSKQGYSEKRFKAVMLHELGHLFNIDHSQINLDNWKTCTDSSGCDDAYLPTMFPISESDSQRYLTYDDKISMASIYPTSDFTNKFCTFKGEMFDNNGKTLKGVNVYAYRTGDKNPGLDDSAMTKIDVRSWISGMPKRECVGRGTYTLYGIVPGMKYQLAYEPIEPIFVGVSGMGPFANKDSVPLSFKPDKIVLPSGSETFTCANGGEVVEAASTNVVSRPLTDEEKQINKEEKKAFIQEYGKDKEDEYIPTYREFANPCSKSSTAVQPDSSDTSGESSSKFKCSLGTSSDTPSDSVDVFFLLAAFAVLCTFRRHAKSHVPN